MSAQVGHLLDELTNRYIPAYANLARANVRSLERALALRRMVIAKMQTPPDEASYKARLETFLVPIDDCYRLVGEVRRHWQGINGGDLVWRRIEAFFGELRARARALVAEDAG